MLNFLKHFSKNWIALLGLIPAFYDLVSAYLPWDFIFPKPVVYFFAGLSLLYASYRTYDEEHKKRIELEKKIAGPTDYQITAILIPIDFEIEKLATSIDKIEQEAISKLEDIKPIKDRFTSSKLNKYSSYVDEKHLNKTNAQYNRELEGYIYELKDIIENKENYKTKLKETILSWQKQYYHIEFTIENIGITSDTDIQIDIICLDETIVFDKFKSIEYDLNLYSLLPSIPKKPEKPKVINPFENNHLNPYARYIPDINKFNNPNAFRKMIEIKDKNCSVTIRDLHVGDKINIFKEDTIIKKDRESIMFNATIKSKESTKVLSPEVVLKYIDESKSF